MLRLSTGYRYVGEGSSPFISPAEDGWNPDKALAEEANWPTGGGTAASGVPGHHFLLLAAAGLILVLLVAHSHGSFPFKARLSAGGAASL